MKPAQVFVTNFALPQQYAAASAAFQELLRGPEGVSGAIRLDPDQPRRIEAPCHCSHCVGDIGRLHERNALPTR